VDVKVISSKGDKLCLDHKTGDLYVDYTVRGKHVTGWSISATTDTDELLRLVAPFAKIVLDCLEVPRDGLAYQAYMGASRAIIHLCDSSFSCALGL